MSRRSVKSGIVVGIAALLACNGGGIPPAERYQLAFLDRDGVGKVKVRWSDDGLTWQSGTVPNNETGSTGPGMTASPDGVGATTVLAYGHPVTGIRLKFGVGPTFAAESVDLDERSVTNQTILDLGNNIYLIGTLRGPNNDAPAVLRYNHSTGQILDVTPGVVHNGTHHAPQLAYLPSARRVVAAWHDTTGFTLAAATVNEQQEVAWTGPITPPDPPPEFHDFVPSPALATDAERFHLGIVRETQLPSPSGQFQMFRFTSENGVDWTALGGPVPLEIHASKRWFLQMAMTSRCGFVVIALSTDNPPNPTQIVVRDNSGVLHFPSETDVFGERPHLRAFSLIRRGFAPPAVLNDCF